MTGIYHKLYDKKQGPYIITEFFTSVTFRFQRGQVNELIRIKHLTLHFVE